MKRWKPTKKKADEKMDKFDGHNSADNQSYSRNTAPWDELNHCEKEDDRYKQINERIRNMEKKILDIDEKSENRSDEPKGAKETRIKVRL